MVCDKALYFTLISSSNEMKFHSVCATSIHDFIHFVVAINYQLMRQKPTKYAVFGNADNLIKFNHFLSNTLSI